MLTGTESAQKRPCSDGKKPNRLQQTRLLFMEVGNKPPGTLGTIIGTAPWVQVREDFTGKPEATVGKITMNQWILGICSIFWTDKHTYLGLGFTLGFHNRPHNTGWASK